MKFKMESLVKLVNELVERKVREVLPKVLSEQYIRKLLSEGAAPVAVAAAGTPVRRRAPGLLPSVREAVGFDPSDVGDAYGAPDEEERIPEHVDRWTEQNPALAGLFDGTRRIDEEGDGEGIPVDGMTRAGFDFSRMRQLAETSGVIPPSQTSAESAEVAERAEKMLAMRRKMLEVPYKG